MIKTYPEMKEAIVGILRLGGQHEQYAAQYIEELKAENAALRERIENAVERLKAREQSVCFGEEGEGGCDDFVNVVDVKVLFEERPSSARAKFGVLCELEDKFLVAAEQLARHGVTKMVLHIPDTFRLYREAFIKRVEYIDGWAATAAVYFSAFKNGRQVYPLFDADGRVSSVTYAE